MGRPPIVFSCPSVTLFLRSFYFFFFLLIGIYWATKKKNLPSSSTKIFENTPTNIKQNETFEMLFGVCAIQTSWCTRRRSTRQSQTIWTRLSQNSRHTRDINNATAPSTTTTTTIHFRLDSTRKLYISLLFFLNPIIPPLLAFVLRLDVLSLLVFSKNAFSDLFSIHIRWNETPNLLERFLGMHLIYSLISFQFILVLVIVSSSSFLQKLLATGLRV